MFGDKLSDWVYTEPHRRERLINGQKQVEVWLRISPESSYGKWINENVVVENSAHYLKDLPADYLL